MAFRHFVVDHTRHHPRRGVAVAAVGAFRCAGDAATASQLLALQKLEHRPQFGRFATILSSEDAAKRPGAHGHQACAAAYLVMCVLVADYRAQTATWTVAASS